MEPLRPTELVDKFDPTPWDLFGVLGNVREWCEGVYHDNHIGAPTNVAPDRTDRVMIAAAIVRKRAVRSLSFLPNSVALPWSFGFF
jgi:formylglycine-generating enzyme required for sulfatase activity